MKPFEKSCEQTHALKRLFETDVLMVKDCGNCPDRDDARPHSLGGEDQLVMSVNGLLAASAWNLEIVCLGENDFSFPIEEWPMKSYMTARTS